MSALSILLNKYKNFYAGLPEGSTVLKGKWFETICLYFLKNDPLYKDRFENIYLWHEWPGRNNRPDTGIDIVAKIKDSEKFCAVQCKFYEPEYSISKPDIDTFLAASSKEIFSERIIISTTANWNKNAEDTIQNQNPPCTRLGLENLEQSKIDWSNFDIDNLEKVIYKEKTLREDQLEAVNAVIDNFKTFERGKMIMACGTGKTFTALKIAEKFAGINKKVLFLVPSISLLNQTLLAWNQDREKNSQMLFFAVCSDSSIGKKDNEDIRITDLAIPADTKAEKLIDSWKNISDERKQNSMTVVFSTYQSLKVIHEIQEKGFPEFDLIICDEAHRTAGVTLKDKEESEFVKIHDNNFIRGAKRLYMTATPKVYADYVSKRAQEKDAVIYSMENEKIFGPDFYTLSFSKAIEKNLLTDYKVMILAIDEGAVSDAVVELLKIAKDLSINDATKMVGCWRGLGKQVIFDDAEIIAADPLPMKKAIAFTSTINYSKDFQKYFADVINAFKEKYHQEGLICKVEHVDGGMNAGERSEKLNWLKNSEENSCRILSNAKCLSEGVDVPALDAVLFLNPKKSKADIVQCVGRVMRKSEGKKSGYVILPVVIPPGVTPEEALNSDKNYNVIWDVLQALRSHDDKFDIEVNSLKYEGKSKKILTGVIGKPKKNNIDKSDTQINIPFRILDFQKAVYAKIVEKCGSRVYEEKWARDMADIADNIKTRIKSLLSSGDEFAENIFDNYIIGLRENINTSITDEEALDMLGQHFITSPIFDMIFENFSAQNPVSIVMQEALNLLEKAGLKTETEKIQPFYKKVRERFSTIKTNEGRQKLIKDLYENFFKTAFKKTSERLGIVYTPNEVVDFILRSADWALKNELNIPEGLSSENVNILDPFTGTGTFIVRLIQLGLIPPDKLEYKYKNEIFANEIMLLPYYIAAVNIETAFHSEKPETNFEPFPGVVLTDTFNEANGIQLSFTFTANSKRAKNLHDKKITVIIGNPPYSAGQSSANDNNQNLKYEKLDKRITDTYAKKSTATNKNSLYDSYIRAIRWASDRIEDEDDGIICYVTNGSFLDSNSADGLRKCLYDEFKSIYIFNLRGNQYTAGELSRKEGGKIFGSGSRLPVAVTLLVKKSKNAGKKAKIFYHDIGGYLSREEKLISIEKENSFGEMLEKNRMNEIIPNEHGDWINQRNEIFETFLRLGNKKETEFFAIFDERYSAGIKTNRDAWCYNFSREALKTNMASMIDVYNEEREKWHAEKRSKEDNIQDFVTMDAKKISWNRSLYAYAKNDKELSFSDSSINVSLYRPFTKNWLYFNKYLNDMVYRVSSIFPTSKSKNRVICVTGIGSKTPFSVLMTDCIPDLSVVATGQCFPLYWYEESQEPEDMQGKLFEEDLTPTLNGAAGIPKKYIRRDGISDKALKVFQNHYHDTSITKEEIFYYIYGVLNSLEYKEKFSDDVKKMLARVPLAVKFREFSEAGKQLGDLHVNYEQSAVRRRESGSKNLRVEKMKIITNGGEKFIRYNDEIAIKNIPSEAWEYIVNGKSALEWIVERYQNSQDKDSGLKNDCNAWGIEHDNPRYILDLIYSVIRVSVESVRIIKNLPELGI